MRVLIEIEDGAIVGAKADFPLTELVIVDNDWEDGPVAHRYTVTEITSILTYLKNENILVQQGNPSQL